MVGEGYMVRGLDTTKGPTALLDALATFPVVAPGP